MGHTKYLSTSLKAGPSGSIACLAKDAKIFRRRCSAFGEGNDVIELKPFGCVTANALSLIPKPHRTHDRI